MSEHWVALDLFSGLGGFSQDFEEHPKWDVVTVDVEERFEPDLCADVMDSRPSDLLEAIGIERAAIDVLVILASPPCTEFSTAGNHDHWDFETGEPQHPDARESIALTHHTVGLIHALAPDYWLPENPCGRMRWVLGEPVGRVTYCRYGADFMKPTDLWGEHPVGFEYRACSPGCERHVRYSERDGTSATRPLGDSPEERAKVPEELSEAIREAIEDEIANPPPEQATLGEVRARE